jgi:Flp pilus assembly protein TadG
VPRGGQAGQSTVETALAFPLLVVLALGLTQFALFYHAQTVLTGAVQDGARAGAAADRTVADGVAHARALLDAGLGRAAAEVSLQGTDGGDTVTLEARGRLRAVIPWVADAGLPLQARSVVSKERFRAPRRV